MKEYEATVNITQQWKMTVYAKNKTEALRLAKNHENGIGDSGSDLWSVNSPSKWKGYKIK